MNLSDFENLKSRVDTARRNADRAAGAYAELKKQLQKEFGCDSTRAAHSLLKRLEAQTDEREREFTAALEEFEKSCPEL